MEVSIGDTASFRVFLYIEIAMECQPWPSRNKSMFEVLSIIAQAVWTVRQESRQGSLAYFQPVGPARMRARPRRNSTPQSAAGADQRTPAAASDLSAAAAEFSGLVFTAAIADGRAHAPRGIVLTEAKVKRDRFRAAPQNGRRRKAFSPFKDLRSAERKRKRNHLPTGGVRPSEHDYNF